MSIILTCYSITVHVSQCSPAIEHPRHLHRAGDPPVMPGVSRHPQVTGVGPLRWSVPCTQLPAAALS
jgi:hypothetical protein